ncbi:MAG: SdrD B-like domain-containing protein [Saprospiraceae bacterium]
MQQDKSLIQQQPSENGAYCFYPLNPGTYSVQFVIPAGFDYTASNQGDDASDSDIIPGMNGMTHTVTLEAGDQDITVDGGIYILKWCDWRPM